ncbi:adhesin [Buttiauxella sp. WJP83]|uniref:adhesin n=1 Tax=Buttiauxella sp. WJP83 TaxID=2986951 RepID=UPI0022DD5DAD|nr:adhesin [Buttiauxella sp. WJP83]WBM70318.1 adhesin [Buttiauxella sp. WJP83]
MFKNIALILALISSSNIASVVAEPSSISLNDLVTNSFDADKVVDLAYPVCSLNLDGDKKEGFYKYAEGEICPVGRECTYSAIMKLNGNITILKQVSSDNGAEVFKNDDMTIVTKYTFIEKNNDRENGDVNAVIVIKTKNGEKKVNMSGYCGI